MKTKSIKKNRIKTAVASVLCGLVLTSCWEDFNNKFTGSSGATPAVKAADCQLTAAGITVNWTEPDAVAYTGMKIIITNGTATTETTVSRGTTTSGEIAYAGSGENTITVKAMYSTGYEIENLNFKITPPSVTRTLRLISSAEGLPAINTDSTSLGGYYILMADIDLSDYSSGTGWTPIGASGSAFTGVFDGNGHTISNLTINDSTVNNKGFFGYTSGATIKNITLTGVSVSGKQYIGGLSGSSSGGTISNCSVAGTVNGNMNFIGGLVGVTSTVSITDCYTSGTVINSNSTFMGYAGGLAGETTGGTITGCYSSADVSGGNGTGGLIGHNISASLNDCYATGSVNGSSSTGGLVGSNGGNITSCYATGAIIINTFTSGQQHWVGGLIGYLWSGTITSCYSTGNVDVTDSQMIIYAGSFVGYFTLGSITECYARGNVNVQYSSANAYPVYAGGFIGYALAAACSATKCYTLGNVNVQHSGTGAPGVRAGGFAGHSVGPASYCFARGDVSVQNTGSGTSTMYAGGFVGYKLGSTTIQYCYNTGTITAVAGSGTATIGGFVGLLSAGTITACYYNTDTTGRTDTSAGSYTPVSTDNMKLQSTYQPGTNDWSFTTVWSIDTTGTINNGYPYLTGMAP